MAEGDDGWVTIPPSTWPAVEGRIAAAVQNPDKEPIMTHTITAIEEVDKGWKVSLDRPGPDGKDYFVTEGRPGEKLVVGATLILTPPTPMPQPRKR